MEMLEFVKIKGRSTVPTISDGQTVAYDPEAAIEQVQAGDIILFWVRSIHGLVCHRAIRPIYHRQWIFWGKKRVMWITKGDGNKMADRAVVGKRALRGIVRGNFKRVVK